MLRNHMRPAITKATVLIMGGPDVDLRLELMGHLQADFEMLAAGTAIELQPRFVSAGFRYYPYPLGRTISPVADLYSIGYIWRMCRTLRPHIIHTFDAKPGVWGRLAARWAGVPVVIGTLPGLGSLYANDNLSTRLMRTIYQPLQKWSSHVSDLTIFQNGDDARQFIAAGVVPERKAMVIPGSGVATEVFAPARVSHTARMRLRDELGIQPDEIVVTMISRVIRSKGVLEFMAAAREVGASHPHLRFLLIGPDDDQSLDRLSEAELAQLKQVVTWPGPRRDIPTVLAISDIFVFPSAYREGIPRVLLEAASMGLPIITTDAPGCNEVVENGVNGFWVPAHDSAAISQAMVQLIAQPELRRRFGQASRQRVVARFDLSLIVQQTRSVYQQLLARRASLPATEA